MGRLITLTEADRLYSLVWGLDQRRKRTMLYHDLVAAGVPLDHHESDLYCPVTEATRALIEHHGLHATTFINQLNGERWFDVPFAYLPWWEARSR